MVRTLVFELFFKSPCQYCFSFLFIGASGRKSLPQIAGPINTTGPPLEASGKRESLSVSNRARRSLEFNINSPEVLDIVSKIEIEDDPNDVDAGPQSAGDDSVEVRHLIFYLYFDSYIYITIITIRMGKRRLHPVRKIQ